MKILTDNLENQIICSSFMQHVQNGYHDTGKEVRNIFTLGETSETRGIFDDFCH